jgi:hypothetical protein
MARGKRTPLKGPAKFQKDQKKAQESFEEFDDEVDACNAFMISLVDLFSV